MASRRRGRRLQLRTRVLAGVLAVTIVGFAAFDVFAVRALRSYLIGRVDSNLATVLTLTGARLGRLVDATELGRTPVILRAGLGVYDYLAFLPDHGRPVLLDAAPGVTPALPVDLQRLATAGRPRTVGQLHGSELLRLRARRVGNGTLVVAGSLGEVSSTTSKLRLIVILGSAIALALIAAGVIAIVRRGLRPLESMATQADRINAGDLTHRVGPDDRGSEVGRLATALNGMLARIEAAIREREADQDLMRRFFADASHELRTPLASLRANAELYEQGVLAERSQVDEAMRRIRLEAERMSRLVDDMLGLARLDQRPDRPHEPVDLTSLLAGCAERARITDPGRRWASDVPVGLAVTGDAELLARAVDNLIANVRAHTPAGTTATIAATAANGEIRIEVSDDGPGVPADRVARIFDRFYRAGTRSERPGSGLGLAIVAEIAAAHDGRASAQLDYPHGLRVALTLPAAGQDGSLTSNSHGNPAAL
jgi:two-component system, OmpR family, sensor kinase